MIGLTNTAAQNEGAVTALQTALVDSSDEVRIAAAEALCRIDREEEALPILTEALTHESQWIRLQAANALDRAGEKSRPAIDAMRKIVQASRKEDMFVCWVLAHTLKRLGQ